MPWSRPHGPGGRCSGRVARGWPPRPSTSIVRARTALGRRDRRTMALAVRCADALASAGLVAEELDARLTAGLVARDLGEVGTARRCLDAVRVHRDRGPLVERARAWQAEAVNRLDGGDRAGARRAVSAGLDAVADLQALMGATELRVGAAGHGAALAELGLRIAVDDADPWQVLELLDRWRGASLELAARPPVATGAGPDGARWSRTWPRCGRRRPGWNTPSPRARIRRRPGGRSPSSKRGSGPGPARPPAVSNGPAVASTPPHSTRASGPATCSCTSSSTAGSAPPRVHDGRARLWCDLGVDTAAGRQPDRWRALRAPPPGPAGHAGAEPARRPGLARGRTRPARRRAAGPARRRPRRTTTALRSSSARPARSTRCRGRPCRRATGGPSPSCRH